MGGGHPLPYPPPVSAAPTQKAQAPSSVSRLNGYLNRLNFFLATSLVAMSEIAETCSKNIEGARQVLRRWSQDDIISMIVKYKDAVHPLNTKNDALRDTGGGVKNDAVPLHQ